MRLLFGVDVGAAGHQRFDGAGASRARCGHQSRLAADEVRVRIRPRLEQRLHHRHAAVFARQRDRRHAEIVRRIYLGAGADQALGRRDVVPVGGPVQRRRAVRLRGVDVGALLEERFHRARITAFDGVHQPQVRGAGLRRNGGPDERNQGERDQTVAGGHERLLAAGHAGCCVPGAACRVPACRVLGAARGCSRIMGHSAAGRALFDVDFSRKPPILILAVFLPGTHSTRRRMRTAHIGRALSVATVVVVWGAAIAGAVKADGAPGAPGAVVQAGAGRTDPAPDRALLDRYCVTCHNARLRTAELTLDNIDPGNVGPHAETWEKVLRKIRAGQMPPVGRPRPDAAASASFMSALETSLERASSAAPNPGRPTVHRLNRTEYTNSVRDLLALEIDGRSLLPADDTDAHGFDNNADVLTVSPVLAARYLSAARKISRLAIGRSTATAIETYPLPRQLVQDERLDERLPFGSRGGTVSSTTSRPTANTWSRSGCRPTTTTTSKVWPTRTISRCASIAGASRSSPSAASWKARRPRAGAARCTAAPSGRSTRCRCTTTSKCDCRSRPGSTSRRRVRPQVVGSRRRAPAAAERLAAVERRDVRLEPGVDR